MADCATGVAVVAALGLIVWRYLQGRTSAALLEACAIATLAFFILATRMHERYLFNGLLFTIACIPFARRYLGGAIALSIVLFANSKVKDEAWKFLDFIFTTDQRTKFDKVEGFLPVNAEESKNPMFADDRDLKVFASVLPKARFAPVIPGWEDIAQTASNAIQKIYLGQGEIEPTLKEAAAKINETLAKK